MHWLLLASFIKVFLAGFQTKNVQHSRYIAIGITSIAMSVADYSLIKLVSHYDLAVSILIGGAGNTAGMLCSVYIYNKLFNPNES
jgi:uncharacterized membrane protein